MVQIKSITDTQKRGSEAVKRLRTQKLSNGLPFMINSKELPKGQCYLEYPNGTIKLVTLSVSKREFFILRELTSVERIAIRRQYHLSA